MHKYEVGDKVLYHGKEVVIESIFMKHEKGWLYTLVGWPNFTVLEDLLTKVEGDESSNNNDES